ncbi:MAG TPA: NAD(P)/FAD-dependent oxidoreductase [Candidatus Methylomirabilis sp.]|nr:NAD(P)/FAD-dependent oxidoreductase [Candidatus Methylomirabilis sp.]
MKLNHDVLVIGAGPAGSTVAERLAADGFDVAVLEEHAVIGEPVDCTGVIGVDAFADFDLPRRVVVGTIETVTIHSPGDIPATYQATGPLAYIVDRAELDRSLAARAEAFGATVLLSTQVVDVARTECGVEVTCRRPGGEGCKLFGRMLVLAGGPRFAFHERMGLKSCALMWRSAHAELLGDGLPHPHVYLGRDVAPGAFAWAVPVKGWGPQRIRIGVNSHGDAPRYLRRLCEERFPHLIPGDAPIAYRTWVVPIHPPAETYGDRVLAVGDAAGQVKPTSGGGIYYGMLSARAAADTVADGFRCGKLTREVLSTYERRWRSRLSLDLKVGTLFRRLFTRMTDRDVDDLFRALSADGLMARITEKVSFDWHGALILFLLKHPSLARILLRRCWEWPAEPPMLDR